MTAAAAQGGLESVFSYGVTVSGSTTYTAINNVSTIDGPEMTQAAIEIAILGATYKGKVPGQWDAGEVSFSVYWNGTDTTHQFLESLLGTQTILNWKILYPDASFFVFPGFLSSFGTKGMSADEAVEMDGVITLSGAPAFTT